MFQPETPTADSFEAGYNFQRAERLWSAELHHFPLCGWMAQRDRTHFRHVAIRNPTDTGCPRPINPRLGILIVESQRRAQPYFHEPTRLDDREVQAFDGILDLLLRA